MPDSSPFQPPWWLRNPHLQTLWPVLLRPRPRLPWRREQLELPDGDCLELCWGPAIDGPLVLLLHGLGGCVDSGYITGLGKQLAEAGMQVVVMHYRGVGRCNRLDRFYHAGAVEDLQAVVEQLRQRHPGRAVAVVGYSLGGSILLNWLGEAGADAPVQAAVAVSVPFQLNRCADALEQGFGRLYQWDLLRSLRLLVHRKFAGRAQPPVDLRRLRGLRTLRRFDDEITAPLHGFAGVDDYYQRCSSRQRLASIRRPTLILHAADDPFVPADALPGPDELSPWVDFQLTRYGGHVGFVAGGAGAPEYWLDRRITEYLRDRLSTSAAEASSA